MATRDYGFDEIRLEKRRAMQEKGLEPYPYTFEGALDVAAVRAAGEALPGEGTPAPEGAEPIRVRTAGRVWSRRDMGKTVFADLKDRSAKIQLYLSGKVLPVEMWEAVKLLDLGDWIGVDGELFRTRTGELTIRVTALEVLAKSVVSIPIGKESADGQTFYRSADVEAKYRERYLNWMLNDDDRRRIELRSKIIASVRRRMEADGFLEVATPTIEFVYGGAEARPFETTIWALDNRKGYMRISPELYLKRYIVAGFPKVFSICQNFRNEGIDFSHNPEFTMMEFYEAFTDYQRQMKRFETLVSELCLEFRGSMKITYQGRELDFTPPWRRLTVLDGLKEYAGLDAGTMSVEELTAEMKKRGLEAAPGITWGKAVMELFEAICEEHLVQPTFVMDHPLDISPLTKRKRGDSRLVERFEPYASCIEIGNAYSELTDPVDQLRRLETQRAAGNGGEDYDVHPVDADFVKAIGCGMPPTGGVGIGIDRIIMLLTDSAVLRDIIPFPMYKPRG